MGRKINVYDKLTIQLTYALVYERLTDGMLPSCPLVTDERYAVWHRVREDVVLSLIVFYTPMLWVLIDKIDETETDR